MGGKLVEKISQFSNSTHSLYEIYETEDGNTVLYATFNIEETDRVTAYQELVNLLSKSIDDEKVKKQIIG
jgi:hypothetical protein